MSKKHKEIVLNKKNNTLVSSKYLKPRHDSKALKIDKLDDKNKKFLINFSHIIKKAAIDK